MKKALVILNPHSGVKKANKDILDILDIFVKGKLLPTILTTQKRGDATRYVNKYAADYDLVIAIGGDGTFNETVEGMMTAGLNKPIGYIPAGSTNDFASSLKLSSDLLDAARDIVDGEPLPIDIGKMNGRYFSYVASFGAFTRASYNVSQKAKNVLGHAAYLIGGATELRNIKPIHAVIEADDRTFEGDYLFGAIMNATSIGGVLKLSENDVDLNDGELELLLVKMPTDVLDLPEIAKSVALQSYVGDTVSLTRGRRFLVKLSEEVDWSLDGEYQKGCSEFEIVNVHSGINLICSENAKRKETVLERAQNKLIEVVNGN